MAQANAPPERERHIGDMATLKRRSETAAWVRVAGARIVSRNTMIELEERGQQTGNCSLMMGALLEDRVPVPKNVCGAKDGDALTCKVKISLSCYCLPSHLLSYQVHTHAQAQQHTNTKQLLLIIAHPPHAPLQSPRHVLPRQTFIHHHTAPMKTRHKRREEDDDHGLDHDKCRRRRRDKEGSGTRNVMLLPLRQLLARRWPAASPPVFLACLVLVLLLLQVRGCGNSLWVGGLVCVVLSCLVLMKDGDAAVITQPDTRACPCGI